MRINKLSFGNY